VFHQVKDIVGVVISSCETSWKRAQWEPHVGPGKGKGPSMYPCHSLWESAEHCAG
jgi:hypothetical protein